MIDFSVIAMEANEGGTTSSILIKSGEFVYYLKDLHDEDGGLVYDLGVGRAPESGIVNWLSDVEWFPEATEEQMQVADRIIIQIAAESAEGKENANKEND